MPELDGVGATDEIRELTDAESARTPIVALTANEMSGDRERYLELGFDDYVSRPIDQNQLLATISRRARVATS